MKLIPFGITILPMLFPLAASAQYGSLRNGTLDEAAKHKPTDDNVVAARKAGWKLPEDLVWAAHWEPNPSTGNGSLEYLRTGGMTGSAAVRLGGGGHIASYLGPPEPGKPYVAVVRVKGHGKLWFGAYHYSKDGFLGPRPAFVEREIDSDRWTEYRGLFPNDNSEVASINPAIGATGDLLIDEVQLFPAEPADVEMVREIAPLYGTGALVENLELQAVKVDTAIRQKLSDYRQAVTTFREKKAGANKELADSVEKKVAELAPYLKAETGTLMVTAFNDMIVLTRVLQRLAGGKVVDTPATSVEQAPVAASDYKPGARPPRPGRLTITDVHSNKVRYDENETATTRASLVNSGDKPLAGTLIALMHLDLDTVREVARTPFSLNAGESKEWSFTYNVGAETYGRGIEVRLVDEKKAVLDSWQEFYAVAAEYFRVQQHSYEGQNNRYPINPWVTYLTQRHYFANEPTDFGVCTPGVETWDAGQTGWRINRTGRRAEIEHFKSCGVPSSFYQTFAPCGLMGYELLREHPEFALYDANGQFAVDPIYGGYPNPMELASPMEVGPKRKVAKPYLDRKYTPWQHTVANFASEEAVVFESDCIRQYARENGFDGIYIDGTMGAFKGYGYDGKLNVASDKPEEYARLNTRNHRIFSEIVKKDNPNFGTWYNWGRGACSYYSSKGLTMYYGSGVDGERSDAAIREATGWRNVMILLESSLFAYSPSTLLDTLLGQRDFIVQKYEGNSIIGYNWWNVPAEEPGPSKWGWPTVNYMGAQLISTQMHHAGGFRPSFRPTLQFQTRHSSLLWARDIKAMPAAEAEQLVQLASPEALWWKRLVYKRNTKDGYDLIVHLVRIPPTKQWDINWVEEPLPLQGVRMTLKTGTGKLTAVYALRPYHFEEEQQPVHSTLKPTVTRNRAVVEVPPFRYHTMVVFRVRKSL